MTSSATLTAIDEAAALEDLHALGCTDGLPVVIPTPERVGRLVVASGLDGDLVLGAMGPAGGLATVEKVMTSAVMAGCLPDHVPVVLAAVAAILDERFDLGEVQATTHCVAPLFIVNGPARAACGGIASGFGALGPGHRANAAIGRAVRLCMINIGGARPGVSDMALLGHPGKFTYLMGEAEEDSPFPPLHTVYGFTADQSAVTVVGVEAPHSVMVAPDPDPAVVSERILTNVARTIAGPGTNNACLSGGCVVVALNPEHAAALAAAGYDRSKVAEELAARARNRRSEITPLELAGEVPGGPDALVPALTGPEKVVLVVAGGGGLYSMVMPSWAAGPHRSPVVTKEVDLFPACEIPGLGR